MRGRKTAPELLMLDEPFGALDAFTREELWCVIRDLREAVFLADRMAWIEKRSTRWAHRSTMAN